jgi:hypothetical protein
MISPDTTTLKLLQDILLKTLGLIENAWQNRRSSTHAQRFGIVISGTN